MALPQGINFRQTSVYVTDGANEDNSTTTTANYPVTTAQGNNVGWEQNIGNSIDRDATYDRRLAGFAVSAGTQENFRIDLPATGNYNVRLAVGEKFYGCDAGVTLYDTNTSLGALATGTTSAAARFKDATDTEYTNVTWPGSNSAVSKTFTTTICRFRLAATSNVRLAHVYIESAGGGTPLLVAAKPRFTGLDFNIHKKNRTIGLRGGLSTALRPEGVAAAASKAVKPHARTASRAELVKTIHKGRPSRLVQLAAPITGGVVVSGSGLAIEFRYSMPWLR